MNVSLQARRDLLVRQMVSARRRIAWAASGGIPDDLDRRNYIDSAKMFLAGAEREWREVAALCDGEALLRKLKRPYVRRSKGAGARTMSFAEFRMLLLSSNLMPKDPTLRVAATEAEMAGLARELTRAYRR
jgi:hypothetical protein